MYISLEQELQQLEALGAEIEQMEAHQDRLDTEGGVTVELVMESERLTGNSAAMESYFSGDTATKKHQIAQEAIIAGISEAMLTMIGVILGLIAFALATVFGKNAGKAKGGEGPLFTFKTSSGYDSDKVDSILRTYERVNALESEYRNIVNDIYAKMPVTERLVTSECLAGEYRGSKIWIKGYKDFFDRDSRLTGDLEERLRGQIKLRDDLLEATDRAMPGSMSIVTPKEAFAKESVKYGGTPLRIAMDDLARTNEEFSKQKENTATVMKSHSTEVSVFNGVIKILDTFNFTRVSADIVKVGEDVEKLQARLKDLEKNIETDGHAVDQDRLRLEDKRRDEAVPDSIGGKGLTEQEKAQIRMSTRRAFGHALRELFRDIATIARALVTISNIQGAAFKASHKLLKASVEYMHKLAKEDVKQDVISNNLKTMQKAIDELKKSAKDCGFAL